MMDGGSGFKSVHAPLSKGDVTLRDWFAGQALAGLLQSVYERHGDDYEMTTGGGPAAIARMAYVQADAMNAEREKTP